MWIITKTDSEVSKKTKNSLEIKVSKCNYKQEVLDLKKKKIKEKQCKMNTKIFKIFFSFCERELLCTKYQVSAAVIKAKTK